MKREVFSGKIKSIEFAMVGKLSRKVISRSNCRVTGKFPSIKCSERRMLHFESSLEEAAFLLHEVNSYVLNYKEQPAKIKFEMDGVEYAHYPDLLVETERGKVFKEIKYRSDAEDPFIYKRTRFLSKSLPILGYEYEVITDDDILKQPRLDNSKYLFRYGRHPIDIIEQERIRKYIEKEECVLWGDVKRDVFGDFSVTKICRLIIDGVLAIDMDAEWFDDTLINRRQ